MSIFTTTANVTASPSDVRQFAIDNGFDVGTRGRFSAELIDAFNRASARKYSVGAYVDGKTAAKVRDNRGKLVTRHFIAADVRKVLVDHGYAKPGRGRLPKGAYALYADILRNN